jgi:predicted nucleic acid-binding Zn ribbon protein
VKRRRPAEFASLRVIGNTGRFDEEVRGPAAALAVFEAWRKSAGPRLGALTRPVEWNGHRLVVEVSDPLWLRHLDRMRDRLLPELNAALAGDPGTDRRLRVDRLLLRPWSP